MAMDSSRRSAPFAREPAGGVNKKQRISPDDLPSSTARLSGRPIDPRTKAPSPSPAAAFTDKNRDRDSEEGSDSFVKAKAKGSSNQHHQLQELVTQYKTALVELTFNSKPIITNLTIIAGENLQAAKPIAATICANILEVPSEQKLPSLYLLDSIVKNIGRDYVKYFSARLPEVFCKAYEQVDVSTHSSMRHLFGTWKGVFPHAPLQIIEKELGFPPMSNGSNSSAHPKLDAQTQRPPHSIHVNPKYLEKHRLQHSAKTKEISSGDVNDSFNQAATAERTERPTTSGSGRQWTDPLKTPLGDSVNEKKRYREQEYSSDISKQTDLRVVGVSDRIKEEGESDKQWFGTKQTDLRVVGVSDRIKEEDESDKQWFGTSNTTSGLSFNRRNGLDDNNAYVNFREAGSVLDINKSSLGHENNAIRSNHQMHRSWKNSEEEEYMWDDMASQWTDNEEATKPKKVSWDSNDADVNVGYRGGKWLPVDNHVSQRNKLDTYTEPKNSRRKDTAVDSHESQCSKLDTYTEPKNSRREDRVPFVLGIEENFTRHRQQAAGSTETSTDLLSTRLSGSRQTLWPRHEASSSSFTLNHTDSTIGGPSDGIAMPFNSSLSPGLSTTGHLSHSVPSSLGPSTSVVSGLKGTFGQKFSNITRSPSPSGHLNDHDGASQSLSHTHRQTAEQINLPPHALDNQDSRPFALSPSRQNRSPFDTKQLKSLQSSSTSSALGNLPGHLPYLQKSQPDVLWQQSSLSQAQPSSHIQKLPPLPPTVDRLQAGHYGTGQLKNSTVDFSGPSSVSKLVDDILKSGCISNNLAKNENIHPPLPNGPPPLQALPSAAPLSAPTSVPLPITHGCVSSAIEPLIKPVPPPLPPGPPPPSSLHFPASQISTVSNIVPNPLSTLLNSLLANGLIKPSTEYPSSISAGLITPSTDFPSPISAESPKPPSTGEDESSTPVDLHVPSTSSTLFISSGSAKESLSPCTFSMTVATVESTSVSTRELIGTEFRPDIIREFNLLVVNSLTDDLKHHCNKCGMKFKLQEQLRTHLNWHTVKECSSDKRSRKWFVDAENWFDGSSLRTPYCCTSTSVEEVKTDLDSYDEMVPADESQCICALCGEPFDDFYSIERDEWMYKGAVFLKLPGKQNDKDREGNEVLAPIVHAKCI